MAHFFIVWVILSSFITSGIAQNLTISSSGQTGTSGTNWSITGNTLNVAASGSADIHPSVITNHLSNVGDLTVNLPWQSLTARDINIDASISYVGSSNRTLTINGANDMVFANATGITSSTASLNLVLRTALGSAGPDDADRPGCNGGRCSSHRPGPAGPATDDGRHCEYAPSRSR